MLSLLCLVLASFLSTTAASYYNLSSDNLGRVFDGIGGLSGGGATSRLLPDYIEPYRSHILDYLFLPSFGASLHVLKVEIGGDAQSTEGTEASHMHIAEEENYQRGYEWWLMKEAKARNPSIALYGLSWGFPGWVAENGTSPLTNSTVSYITKWLLAARDVHGLTIDYIGVWNENAYSRAYILSLHASLKAHNLSALIVAADDCCPPWNVCDDLLKDKEWASAVARVGGHYPNSLTTDSCAALDIPKWASEDFSSYYKAGACWSRLLNRNYVYGNMTSTIAWNLIAAYYADLPYSGDGLMSASYPWSGHYEVDQVIWATAHTTQFTAAGWRYLAHGAGVGQLTSGGTYVSLTDGQGGLTIVVEAMTRDISGCVHEDAPPTNVTGEYVSFRLTGDFARIEQLYVWQSQFDQGQSQWFMYEGQFTVDNGVVTIALQPNTLWTLTTVKGMKGNHTAPPPASPFPFPYADDFDSHPLSSQAPYFTDQSGSFEVVAAQGRSGQALRQMMPRLPVSWCGETPLAYSLMGSHAWRDVNVTASVYIEQAGTAFVAAAVTDGGCLGGKGSGGFTFAIASDGRWLLANDTGLAGVLDSGESQYIEAGRWYRLSLVVSGDSVSAYAEGYHVSTVSVGAGWRSGWAAIGSSYDYVQFDDFSVAAPSASAATNGADEAQLPRERSSVQTE